MRRKLLLAAATLALAVAILAQEACPYCKNTPYHGAVVTLLQCTECYQQFCSDCEVNKDGVYVCPWCKRGQGYPVGQLGR